MPVILRSGSKGLRTLLAFALSTALQACHPAEQGRATFALLTRTEDGFIVEIPACPDGSVGRFDIFASGDRSYSVRARQDMPRPARIVALEVSAETLQSKDFGPDVRLLDSDGDEISAAADIRNIYLNTDVGYVEFDPRDVVFSEDGRAVLHGDSASPATATDSSARMLADACD